MHRTLPIVSTRSGFSLLQLSMLLMIGGMMLAASLPGGDAASAAAKTRITMERMAKIEEAMQAFMTSNQRRPMPAQLTHSHNSTFGHEAISNRPISPNNDRLSSTTLGGTYTLNGTSYIASTYDGIKKNWLFNASNSTINDPAWVEEVIPGGLRLSDPIRSSGILSISFINPLMVGGVPTRTLGLPDEYAIDGFGRRIMYMVDLRVTKTSGCSRLHTRGETGALALSNDVDFTTGTYDNVMWALLSYGQDGQGGMSMQGGGNVNSTRLKTGNLDEATLYNAFYDTNENTVYNPQGLVNKPPTTTFDDIVWVNEATKNTCALGNINSNVDFRINSNFSSSASSSHLSQHAFGDINGDGYPDMILGSTMATNNTNGFTIVFGKKYGWPNFDNSQTPTVYTSNNDKANTFWISNLTTQLPLYNFGSSVAVGDVNGDGIDDMVLGAGPYRTTGLIYKVIFGKRSQFRDFYLYHASLPTQSMTASEGITITNAVTTGSGTFQTGNLQFAAPTPAVGDVNGDGYDDITIPFDTGYGGLAMGTIYGKTSGSWSDITLTTGYLNGTNGVFHTVVTPNDANGQISYGSAHDSLARQLTTTCDVNNDGNTDLLMPGSAKSLRSGEDPHGAHLSNGYSNSSSQNLYAYINIPPQVEGDMLIAVITTAGPTVANVTLPAGFTLLGSIAASNVKQFIAYRVIGVGDQYITQTNNVPFTASQSTYMTISLIRVRGVDLYHPIEAVGTYTSDTGTTATPTLPAVTTATDDSLIIYTLSAQGTQTLTDPGGTTKLTRYVSGGSPNSQVAVHVKSLASAGDSGTASYTIGAASSVVGHTLALRKALPLPQRMYLKLGTGANYSHSSGRVDPSSDADTKMLTFPVTGAAASTYELIATACRDINNDSYDDVMMYMRDKVYRKEYLYTYFGNASVDDTDMDADYDLRLDLSSGAPVSQFGTLQNNQQYVPRLSFGDMNNDGRTDLIFSRRSETYRYTTNPFRLSYTTSGTSITQGGLAYVLFQPEDWGTTPNLTKGLHSYNLQGKDGFVIAGGIANRGLNIPDAADMNRDGKHDLMAHSTVDVKYVLFGKNAWPPAYYTYCIYSGTSMTDCPTQLTYR